ncbi:amidohydrolase family protein [Stenotrophomonas rhizophila]|nr:hypothetical protein [Stenotrophomonas rhizophila]
MRKLHPTLTDEAVENRIARSVRRLQSKTVSLANGRQVGAVEAHSGSGSKQFRLSLPDLLGQLASTLLCEGRDGSIRVRTQHLSLWQDLILVVPPLLITSAFIADRIDPAVMNSPRYSDHQILNKKLSRWLCDSTLPIDDDPFLDHLSATEGFDETHMHLNGTTEAEKVWCDALERPQQVVGRLVLRPQGRDSGLATSIGDGVAGLLLQEDSTLTADKLMQRTLDAIELKTWLLQSLSLTTGKEAKPPGKPSVSTVTDYRSARNSLFASSQASKLSRIGSEAWQLAIIYQGIKSGKLDSSHHAALWRYALLRSQFCRLLVQQSSNKGFDQFQHITLNELREETEKAYAERFRQIERGHQRAVAYVEGRFAPKASPKATADLVGQILRGYLEFLTEDASGTAAQRRPVAYGSLAELLARVREYESEDKCDWPTNAKCTETSTRRLRLGLVPHFIKQSNAKDRDAFYSSHTIRASCREAKLRLDTDQRARALVSLIQCTPGLEGLIRGVDAASNERHAGAEVFAPTYRRMRSAGVLRFTYHAGEDFAHLASGLRAIAEAVLFLELDSGCRVGHGTAAGLNPKRWWRSVGGAVVMAAEDRLDDLVVARMLLLRSHLSSKQMPLIEAEINRLSMRIWGDPRVTPEILADAWLLRSLDPLVRSTHRFDVDPQKRTEGLLHFSALHSEPLAYAHFLRRHGVGATAGELRCTREEIVVFQDSDVLRPRDLRLVQHAVLKLMHDRRIAIETLPSSNVRISIHETYEHHHATYWLGAAKSAPTVPVRVVVGTDDPGIFATSLRTEYAHLQRALEFQAREHRLNVGDILRRVSAESKLYRF